MLSASYWPRSPSSSLSRAVRRRTIRPAIGNRSSGTRSPLPERCPPSLPNCLAWDAFSGPSGPTVLSTSGQPWATWGLACPDCRPVFETDGSRARMAPGADKNFIWLATIDTGYATGITVSANIRLSPTPLRANVGLVALFADRMNHLVCKVEVTEGHPDGLLAIGDQQHGTTTSLLAYRDDVGLVGGKTYRLELRVPSSPAHSRVTCRASGQGIEPTKVAYQMTAADIAAYGGEPAKDSGSRSSRTRTTGTPRGMTSRLPAPRPEAKACGLSLPDLGNHREEAGRIKPLACGPCRLRSVSLFLSRGLPDRCGSG